MRLGNRRKWYQSFWFESKPTAKKQHLRNLYAEDPGKGYQMLLSEVFNEMPHWRESMSQGFKSNVVNATFSISHISYCGQLHASLSVTIELT